MIEAVALLLREINGQAFLPVLPSGVWIKRLGEGVTWPVLLWPRRRDECITYFT